MEMERRRNHCTVIISSTGGGTGLNAFTRISGISKVHQPWYF